MAKKLLIADDNRAITEVLKLNFHLLGYVVQVALDGEEAEKKFASFLPDLMILDVMMPKKNGFQVCRNLKKNPAYAKIPVILLTAKNLKEDVYWGYDCGADAYVTKPYDPRQLELLVDQLIQEAATGKKLAAWTGLPHATRLLEEHAARLEAGSSNVLLELSFSREAVEAFTKRYGTPPFKDLIHTVAWRLRAVCQQGTSAGVVGQTSEDAFLFSLDPGEADDLRSDAEKAVSDAVEEAVRAGEKAHKDSETAGEEPPPSLPCRWRTREVPPDP